MISYGKLVDLRNAAGAADPAAECLKILLDPQAMGNKPTKRI